MQGMEDFIMDAGNGDLWWGFKYFKFAIVISKLCTFPLKDLI